MEAKLAASKLGPKALGNPTAVLLWREDTEASMRKMLVDGLSPMDLLESG